MAAAVLGGLPGRRATAYGASKSEAASHSERMPRRSLQRRRWGSRWPRVTSSSMLPGPSSRCSPALYQRQHVWLSATIPAA